MPNDEIYVLHQGIDNDVNLSSFDGEEWIHKTILQHKDQYNIEVYFKAVCVEDEIHIFYSILNLQTKMSTFFHQTADKNMNFSKVKVIDNVKCANNVPFDIKVSENKEIYIMYEKMTDKYELGYRKFSEDKWSNFYLIEKNVYPYSDYSMLLNKGDLHFVFIRNNTSTKSVVYCIGNHINFIFNKLYEGEEIDSCLSFIIKNNVWITWIEKDKVYSSFSINDGKNFSMPPYCEYINSSDIIKANYISNFYLDKKNIVLNQAYLEDKEGIRYVLISSVYPYITLNSNDMLNDSYDSYWIYVKECMNKAYEEILSFQKIVKQKEREIFELNSSLASEKLQANTYEIKYKKALENYENMEKERENISGDVSELQEKLIKKDEKITELESTNIELQNVSMEKDNEIITLTNEVSKFEENLHELKQNIGLQNNKIVKFEGEAETLKTQIAQLEFRLNSSNNSFFKKIFGQGKENE